MRADFDFNVANVHTSVGFEDFHVLTTARRLRVLYNAIYTFRRAYGKLFNPSSYMGGPVCAVLFA